MQNHLDYKYDGTKIKTTINHVNGCTVLLNQLTSYSPLIEQSLCCLVVSLCSIHSNNSDKLCESGEDDSRLDQKAQLQMKQILTVKDDDDKLRPNQLCYNSV